MLTVRSLVSLFDRFNRVNRARRTAEYYLAQWAPYVERFGELAAGELAPRHLLELKTSWHRLQAVQRCFRWAVEEMKLLPSNPFDKMRRPRPGGRRRVMARREEVLYRRRARPDMRRFLLCTWATAARPQEVRSFDWADLRWPGGQLDQEAALRAGLAYFELTDYKARDRRGDGLQTRLIPISARLGRLLWRLGRGQHKEGIIFLTDKGDAWDKEKLRLRMRRLRRKVDAPLQLRGERIVCYSWRHSTATEFADRGMQMHVLQELLGHANIRTTERYLHLSQMQLLRAWREFGARRRR